ncbi:uncharacterized protein LOC117641630 isoform X1 [Thrips palmi]|uniref:Uncharacterized protein LOC117641630 isoform X1 n=1 Tax=Thrips palmi TaxID=161013 RepID=A0A6P8YLX4_THRPL|nr:uncharacterized protein LOC117641630 isoform X1 [Thrips palmi]
MVSGPKSEDAELAETLRRDDPEQFLTLVRMHLSFVLDLNTDECDGVSEKSGKFRPMKWSFTPFAKKSKPVNRPVTEGVTLTQEGISQVYQLIQWLSLEQNVIQEGIFRRSGKMTRQQELKVLLTSGCPLKLDEGQFSVHDCASVLKNFLAQLPEPLLTEAYYPAHCQIAELCAGNNEPVDEERLLKAIQLILLLLPLENLQLLKDLFGLLHLTSTYAHVNKMSADNLATLFTPHLLCPRKLSPEALHTNSQTMSKVVSFMIKQGPTLFHIPAQLATDIRAYWSSRDKRTLLPKKDLNESTCDGMAAKTVFTFVDREKTAEASASANPTEAALAQLYAHIQSLPESSKKRKLIKQFNKENGQGTPQLIMGSNRTGRARNRTAGPKPRQRSRSLGDSIKKHIHVFNKGSKEPKKLSDEFYSKEPFDSPHSSPVTKVKNVFQKSDGENILPSPSVMPSLKKSLVMDVDEAKSIRMRLSANAKRTPASVTSENIGTDREESSSTSSNDSNTAGDERLRNVLKRTTSSLSHRDKNVDSKEGGPTKSPRIEPCFPSSVPSTQSGERLATSPDVKHPPGTCRDESWPVSTASASASAVVSASSCGNLSSAGLPSAHNILTPRNVLAWMTSTPAYARACHQNDSPLGNCLLTPSNATGNNSMSPITRSTQKMSKAMQEDMMTPRSRKPVVALSSSNLSQLAHLGGWGRSGSGELRRDATSRATLLSEAGASLSSKLLMKEESFIEREVDDNFQDDLTVHIPIERMLAKEVPKDVTLQKSEMAATEKHVLSGTEGCECCPDEKCATCSGGNGSLDYYSCSSDGSALTGTFREIVLSRSVLTASPVDLSFSSHTGDFDSSSEREVRYVLSNDNLSDSLLYCLNGNEPSCLDASDLPEVDKKSLNSTGAASNLSDKGPVDEDYESSGVEGDHDDNGSLSMPNAKPESKVTNSFEEALNADQINFNNHNMLSADSETEFHNTCVQSEIDRCLSESAAAGVSVNETAF